MPDLAYVSSYKAMVVWTTVKNKHLPNIALTTGYIFVILHCFGNSKRYCLEGHKTSTLSPQKKLNEVFLYYDFGIICMGLFLSLRLVRFVYLEMYCKFMFHH